jgi:hypothetical protein
MRRDRDEASTVRFRLRLDAITYIGRPEERVVTKPSREYADIVRRGYRAHGLPTEALEQAIKNAGGGS